MPAVRMFLTGTNKSTASFKILLNAFQIESAVKLTVNKLSQSTSDICLDIPSKSADFQHLQILSVSIPLPVNLAVTGST